ncbi:glycosyltransferase family 1 protein [Legionella pneumophila serogroup 1]|nr:glycosyltransferase family 1 protein [Legionella pneumophila]MCK0182435.1 glycosyltransferase family 4 protein [Legionella pneumophila]MCK1871472.1 glycosyltransferase family 4 protein [Legionella pneumophila]MCK1880013.1 glycosyltransferase family 4 protein [Legionella pneumophila]MCW8435483.1 glycosyltransferase family 4 protein [Legionella pneumophila]MCW8468825.1 glycosyltransferase family 4 protein [Legionella pneumophila]
METRILIDASSLMNELKRKHPPHGIPRVTLAYLRYYYENMQLLFRTSKRIFIFPQGISKKIADILLAWDCNRLWDIVRLILKGIIYSKKSKYESNYILIKTDYGGLNNPGLLSVLQQNRLKMVALIHDLIPITNPEYFPLQHFEKFTQGITTILHNAKGVVTVSEATRYILSDYISRAELPCPPIISANLAPGLAFSLSAQERPIAQPYFVIISSINERKNHLLLLHIWKRLIQKYGENSPRLVVIGYRHGECNYTYALMDRCPMLQEFVIERQCTDEELSNYLHHALALLFPSFSEGYGLPLVEALSFKVPVIASDLAVFQEVAGDIPDYLDPLDAISWMSCIENYILPDSPMRNAQLDRIKNFRVPSWMEHFDKVNHFIETV